MLVVMLAVLGPAGCLAASLELEPGRLVLTWRVDRAEHTVAIRLEAAGLGSRCFYSCLSKVNQPSRVLPVQGLGGGGIL